MILIYISCLDPYSTYLTLPRCVSINVACHGPPSFTVLRHPLALLEVQAGPLQDVVAPLQPQIALQAVMSHYVPEEGKLPLLHCLKRLNAHISNASSRCCEVLLMVQVSTP